MSLPDFDWVLVEGGQLLAQVRNISMTVTEFPDVEQPAVLATHFYTFSCTVTSKGWHTRSGGAGLPLTDRPPALQIHFLNGSGGTILATPFLVGSPPAGVVPNMWPLNVIECSDSNMPRIQQLTRTKEQQWLSLWKGIEWGATGGTFDPC
jgi:hypothetical protein